MLSCFSSVWLCATLRYGPEPTRLLCPWDSPGKNTGVGCHALLQGIFPTQGLNSGLLHCRVFTIWATKEAQQRPQIFPRQVIKAMVVTNTSSPRSFSKAVPALFIPSSLPRPHNTVHPWILCTELSRVLFHRLPSSPATASCWYWNKKTSGFWCGWGPRGGVFQAGWLKHPRLKGLLHNKNKIHLALKIWSWLAWQRGKEICVCVCVCVFSEWKSRDKTSEAKVSKCFQPTCSFRIAAGQGKAKGKAKLKKVLFCPTGQKSYECFEVRVVTWSKCFRKIN